MNWAAVSDYLAMGGYGLYVWGAFGMAGLVVALEVAQLALRGRALRRRAARANGAGADARVEAEA
ncbi:Heme exporter protein D [Burkholderiales bacterium 8X]|nr:Heme exporter protein D [Burkholderiales bacterium 8X]